MKHPTLEQTSVTTGHYYIDLRLKAGWAIVPDPMNRLLKEYVNGAILKPHAPTAVSVEPKKRGRPRIKK